MIRIVFICHGNICRSPMAEFLMKDLVEKQGLAEEFHIESAATSTEEIGNPVHRGTKRILDRLGISSKGKRARQLKGYEYQDFDYLVGMDEANARNIKRICGGDPEGKVCKLLDFTDEPRSIADPWYTGDFEATYNDVEEGCRAFLKFLADKHGLKASC